jgi:hypothetical protein
MKMYTKFSDLKQEKLSNCMQLNTRFLREKTKLECIETAEVVCVQYIENSTYSKSYFSVLVRA